MQKSHTKWEKTGWNLWYIGNNINNIIGTPYISKRCIHVTAPNALNCCRCKHTRQLSFTNFRIYSKILPIRHLIIWKSWQFGTWVVHWPAVMLFTRKKLYQWNMQISGTCSRRPPGVPVCQPLWYLITRCLLLHYRLQL